MVQRMQVILEDDVDGGSADETVTFAIDGIDYEIDLTTKNAKALRTAIAPWADKGRKIGGRRKRGTGSKPATGNRNDLTAVREWAAKNGYQVSTRGRIAAPIMEAYESAHR